MSSPCPNIHSVISAVFNTMKDVISFFARNIKMQGNFFCEMSILLFIMSQEFYEPIKKNTEENCLRPIKVKTEASNFK
jgi:hypothetical protein